jgi:arylsulfatase A-like enzyme
MRFDNCFCTNSICAPSRATILTGTYNHINGVTTLGAKIDGRQENFAKLLQGAGYQTALVGKWHLGHGGHHDPTGFDHWDVLPGQGDYHNPEMNRMGDSRRIDGYVTDIITDLSLEWLEARDKDRPFCLMLHHKAPHRWWEPDEKHAEMYEDVDIPEPETLWDDYENRASAAREAKMRVDRDLSERDLKGPTPDGLSPEEEKRWKYQRYIKDYLRCVASVDDNVGRVIDYLDVDGAAKNTLICYTSDQGFFLGDHGWYDKRFMYEESLRMPFIVRYPEGIQPGSVNQRMVLNVDFPATFLDYAGVEVPGHFQGRSLRSLLEGATSDDWRTSMYYRYWMHLSQHHVYAHYGIRTHDYKLIYYYADALGQPGTVDDTKPPEWELFDLQKDPSELNNVFNDPAYAEIVPALRTELRDLQLAVDDEPYFKEDDL